MNAARQDPESLFNALDIRLARSGKYYVGRCPVHGGRSHQSLVFYPTGTRKDVAFWQCQSHHCETTFSGNLLGFVRGVLSHRKGWESPTDVNLEATKRNAVEFLCELLGVTWDTIKFDVLCADRDTFSSGVEGFSATNAYPKAKCTYKRYLKLVDVPAQYFVDRGYTREVLERYGVGTIINPKSPMYGRIAVPTLSDDGIMFYGCIGRSVHEKCPTCKMYHDPNGRCFKVGCRTVDYCKWRCCDGFQDKDLLYNYWNAIEHLSKNNNVLVIVEGCGDVWRLEEAGVHNSVAINGANLSDAQVVRIESSGATSLICMTDNDKAGNLAYDEIVKKMSKNCSVVRVKPPGNAKDVGEVPVGDPVFDHVKALCTDSKLLTMKIRGILKQ